MSLVRWNPFREIEDFLNGQYPTRSGRPDGSSQEMMTMADWAPAVDISETAKAYVIKAELAGMKREDIQVELNDGLLRISGERKYEKKDADDRQHRIERFYGSFARSFSLPDNVDAQAFKAEYADGVLTLTVPKRENKEPSSRRIKID